MFLSSLGDLTRILDLAGALLVIICCIIGRIILASLRSKVKVQATAYNKILEDYNAIAIYYMIYEWGLKDVPKNNVALIFLKSNSFNFKLRDNAFNKIINIQFDKINWIVEISANQRLDIPVDLPKINASRLVVSYKTKPFQKDKFIIFNTSLPENDNCIPINSYVVAGNTTLMDHLYRNLPLKYKLKRCPDELIHTYQEQENEENTIHL